MNIHLFFKNLPMFRFFSQICNRNLIVYLHTESTKKRCNVYILRVPHPKLDSFSLVGHPNFTLVFIFPRLSFSSSFINRV